ncbi:HAD family phosphatase [Opitutus sp. GAS368]|uniref:HAD family hydrolase n=1 Tax=Opitutus sp. GAS368 TaxID=1882749 RepID=UPI00087D5075|nr:HAD family phosphatase [Opitutus sp. GAS368]SDS48817.1 haloacid dehalogenase superfamily, subfamily IA, variant 3 with third motif having DD or ED/haloacid dehalogenase superfamily, subfamily IA, variant 1 with third motif having Dx(3-4)D or Dx(3-4)E [Opitutus sp. GAS368]
MQLNPEGVIFDLDGTLIASEGIYRDAWRQAARELGIALTDEVYARLIGLNRHDTIIKLAEMWSGREQAESFVDLSQHHYDTMVAKQGHALRPGVRSLLDHLARQKMPLAVATSSARQLALDTLAAAKLTDYFQVVVGGDEIARGKPGPEIYLEAAARLGCNPTSCVAFEDSVNGATAALWAGMTVVLVPELGTPAHDRLARVIRLGDHNAAIDLFPAGN